ncbi:MAG TPA: hypothetical protein PK313_07630, partial [Myxococcota bacterium]|nr:hypothetical protein [Myxococcota bacterium]
LAQAFVAVFSKVGALVIFILGGLLLLLTAFNRTAADLLDALVSTGMFDPQSAWEMVAPLFDIDPAAEPRPQDFPMRFAAPLLAVPTAG